MFKAWLLNEENEQFYWVNRHGIALSPGDTIPHTDPSRFDPLWLFTEEIFEVVRKKIAPSAASRLAPNACFLCNHPSCVRTWNRRNDKIVYEVKPQGLMTTVDAEQWTEASVDLSKAVGYEKLRTVTIEDIRNNERAVSDVTYRAENYWHSDDESISLPEIILNGTATIIRVVS